MTYKAIICDNLLESSMRTTVSHIAKEAGVSPATVDRVLNGRDGVRERTRNIVMDVATRLGYFGPVSDSTQDIRIEFILPAGNNTFMLMLRKYLFEEAAAYGGINASLHRSRHSIRKTSRRSSASSRARRMPWRSSHSTIRSCARRSIRSARRA